LTRLLAYYRIVKRLLVIAGILFVAGAGYSVFYVQRRLAATDRKVSDLAAQVRQAMQTVKDEATAVSAASQRATEAAARAEIAAGARVNAEQQRDQAQLAQSLAESSARQATQQASAAKGELDALRKQREQELDQMQQALSRVAETKRTANGMVVVLPDSTFKFDFDSADLTARNRELLSRVAGILLASKGFGLSVFGYTDDVGTKEYNQRLSERRASAVRGYLVQAGIDAPRVDAKGFGKTNPLVKGETEQARATNRRVEIAVTDSEIKYPSEPPQ
jgi:outer membrane protein OmpA-like peptidoglycan-associated protein